MKSFVICLFISLIPLAFVKASSSLKQFSKSLDDFSTSMDSRNEIEKFNLNYHEHKSAQNIMGEVNRKIKRFWHSSFYVQKNCNKFNSNFNNVKKANSKKKIESLIIYFSKKNDYCSLARAYEKLLKLGNLKGVEKLDVRLKKIESYFNSTDWIKTINEANVILELSEFRNPDNKFYDKKDFIPWLPERVKEYLRYIIIRATYRSFPGIEYDNTAIYYLIGRHRNQIESYSAVLNMDINRYLSKGRSVYKYDEMKILLLKVHGLVLKKEISRAKKEFAFAQELGKSFFFSLAYKQESVVIKKRYKYLSGIKRLLIAYVQAPDAIEKNSPSYSEIMADHLRLIQKSFDEYLKLGFDDISSEQISQSLSIAVDPLKSYMSSSTISYSLKTLDLIRQEIIRSVEKNQKPLLGQINLLFFNLKGEDLKKQSFILGEFIKRRGNDEALTSLLRKNNLQRVDVSAIAPFNKNLVTKRENLKKIGISKDSYFATKYEDMLHSNKLEYLSHSKKFIWQETEPKLQDILYRVVYLFEDESTEYLTRTEAINMIKRKFKEFKDQIQDQFNDI